MRRSNHENIHVLMMIGLVTGEGEEGGKSHSKVGTRWVRQLEYFYGTIFMEIYIVYCSVNEYYLQNL